MANNTYPKIEIGIRYGGPLFTYEIIEIWQKPSELGPDATIVTADYNYGTHEGYSSEWLSEMLHDINDDTEPSFRFI